MFKNFILRLRGACQAKNEHKETSTFNNSSENVQETTKSTNSMDKTEQGNINCEDLYEDGIKVIVQPNSVSGPNNKKNVEEIGLKHNDSILSSDCDDEEVKGFSDNEVKPKFNQLENLIDKETFGKPHNLQNKDVSKTVNKAAEFNNCYTSEIIDSKTNSVLNKLEYVVEDRIAAEIVAIDAETKNTESIETNIEKELEYYMNNVETSDTLPSSLSTDTFTGFQNSEIKILDETTKKCLEEFNEILDKVQNIDDSMRRNDAHSLQYFDNNDVLDADFSADIDPLDNIQICDENEFDIYNNKTERQSFINISSALAIRDKVTDPMNLEAFTSKESPNVDSNNIKTIKECNTDVLKSPIDANIEPNSSKKVLALTNINLQSAQENNLKNIQNNDDDIICISSEDEMDDSSKTECLKEKVLQKHIFNPKMHNIGLKTTENIMNFFSENKIEKFNLVVQKPVTQTIKEGNQKTCPYGLLKTNQIIKKNITAEDIKSVLTNLQRESTTQNKIIIKISNRPNNANEESEKNYVNTPENTKQQGTKQINKSTKTLAENLETISIDSDECLEILSTKSDNSDDCGYHSSDFEFITEEEARKEGLIRKFDCETGFKKPRYSSQKQSLCNRKRVQNDPNGPGPSHQNFNRENISADENQEEKEYSMPDENQLINIFEALPPIPLSEIHHLENKSIQSRVPMLVQYEGIGFDMKLAMRQEDDVAQKYRQEAQESLKKILDMYPENKVLRNKRKRRF